MTKRVEFFPHGLFKNPHRIDAPLSGFGNDRALEPPIKGKSPAFFLKCHSGHALTYAPSESRAQLTHRLRTTPTFAQ